MKLQPVQRHIANTYCHGEYAHLKTIEQLDTFDGDLLFTFLLREVQNCDKTEAIQRLEQAVDDILLVLESPRWSDVNGGGR